MDIKTLSRDYDLFRQHQVSKPVEANIYINGVLEGAIRIAVNEYMSSHAAVLGMSSARLGSTQGDDLRVVFRKGLESTQQLVNGVRENTVPPSVVLGNYHLILYSHFSEILSDPATAQGYAEVAAAPEVQIPPARFWTAYATMLVSLYHKNPVDVPAMKLRREEKTWLPYLNFIHCVTSNIDAVDVLHDIDNCFTLRNAKQGSATDLKCIDGDSYRPVKWNLRKQSLLKVASRVYQLSLDYD